MSHNSDQQSRRERIMNSEKQLPGDADRARDEAIEDFDAPSGNLGAAADDLASGDPARRKAINASDEQLPGDLAREADEKRVDESIHQRRKED